MPRASGLNADSYVLGLVGRKPNLLVPHFLIHSWLYYVADHPLIQDATFDHLVLQLDARWEVIEHRHKALIDRSLLKSGFYLSYPSIVEPAARALAGKLGVKLSA